MSTPLFPPFFSCDVRHASVIAARLCRLFSASRTRTLFCSQCVEGRPPMGTVRTVAQMGYQVVEFYAPYFDWTEPQTREMKKLMDDLGVRCHSTHNSSSYFTPENLKKAQDRNLILGSST